MSILGKAKNILEQPVCDHCLGRQFAQLLHGYTNEERGKLIRTIAAMSIDKSKEERKEEINEESKIERKIEPTKSGSNNLNMSNFAAFEFYNLEFDRKIKQNKCSVCLGVFEGIEKWITKIEKLSKKYKVKTFLIGTRLPFEIVEAEESLWERVGIDYCESIKPEISRETGKLVEKKLKLKYNEKQPDVNFILNIAEGRVELEIKPLFIYGEYQKLKRGIPQTKWPSRKYKTSVEEIIAKPFMRVSSAKAHKLHGLGREDIDARCLGWRPFVLELIEPKNRDINLHRLAKQIKPDVRARKLRFSNIAEVRKIKEAKADKTYRITVECSRKITNADIRKIKSLKIIRQKTPQRVLHRRADKTRKREIKSIKIKKIGSSKFLLTLKCEAGLYVKELVTGDDGRTEPSVASMMDATCKPKDLDVIKIHYPSRKQ